MMTRTAAVLLALAASTGTMTAGPADAMSLSCDPWSVAGHGEHGPITINVTDDALIWSNGAVAYELQLVADAPRGRIYTDEVEVILLRMGESSTFARRLQFAENAPIAQTRCRPLD